VIVNFSSGWGRGTDAQVAPYCATKWAIEGLTRALAQELPKGMAAVPLNPGIIDTAMLRSCFGGDAGHYPTAEVWAATAVPFLLHLGAKDNGKPLTVPTP
jgi:NAD(P)-dependent dehydrogenase (short-subunit alcohol dehydrogenase family)